MNVTIGVTNDGALTNPAPLVYSVLPPPISDGGIVSSWPDSSGHGHTGVKVGSPIIKMNIVGGKPVVRLRSASQDGFDLATSIPFTAPWTSFLVMKPASTANGIISVCGDVQHGLGTLWSDAVMYANCSFFQVNANMAAVNRNLFHVYSITNINTGSCQFRVDGTLFANGGSGPTADTYKHIGYLPIPLYCDGDLAEIIMYAGALGALRFPSINPQTGERAVGDRANIEAGLGVKYGIAQAGGGTPVDPSTVANMLAWWKADAIT
jgi:hypothetical protein